MAGSGLIGYVMSFSRGSKKAEEVVFGSAKLLMMNDSSLDAILTADERSELEAVREYFLKEGMDISAIASKFRQYDVVLVVSDAEEKKYLDFAGFLENDAEDVPLVEVVKKAVDVSVMPLKQFFAKDADESIRKEWVEAMRKKAADDGFHPPLSSMKNRNESDEKEQEKEEKKDSFSFKLKDLSLQSARHEDNVDKEKEEDKGSVSDSPAENEELPKELASFSEKYKKLAFELIDRVKGQDRAIFRFIRGCFQGDLFSVSKDAGHPRACFFFFGPPGVGKTYLSETAAALLGRPFRIFSMSQYADPRSYEELIGTPSIYSNSSEGSLTEYVSKNPDCILLFDEFEKASQIVMRLFLQILGSGKLTDKKRGKDISFERAILIFTSNVGRELYADRSSHLSTMPFSVILEAISNDKNALGDPMLSPELCSRLAAGNLIMFDHLSLRCLVGMVREGFERTAGRMKEEYACEITYPDELPLLLLYRYGSKVDGRIASSQSENFLKDEIYELIWQIDHDKVKNEQIKEIEFRIDKERIQPELKKLFKQTEVRRFLIFADDETVRSADPKEPLCEVIGTSDMEDARKKLEKELAGIIIDPFCSPVSDSSEDTFSVADYDTKGVRFFHELIDAATDMPIYILDTDACLTETDRETFLQEGAWGIITGGEARKQSLGRQIAELASELYMESVYRDFVARGRVISFNTRQGTGKDQDKVIISFYDLKAQKALDAESRKRLVSDAEMPDERFDDVIGAEEAKRELSFYVEFMKNPTHFKANGGKLPNGVLLYGPPGTGKTMLARAFACESGASFIATSATAFLDKYVGETEKNIRDVFDVAKRNAPAVIFIDEIDTIGAQRSGSDITKHTEDALRELFDQMDGFSKDGRKPVFVLAATNASVNGSEGYGKIDPALERRFARSIKVELPTGTQRLEYLKKMTAKIPIAQVSESDLKNVADRTPAKSLAILKNILDMANREALQKHTGLTGELLLNSMERYFYGEKKEKEEDEYRKTAYHETGHAVAYWLSGETPSYITIESRSDFGGYMQHSENRSMVRTRDQLIAAIRTSLAGRASELVFFGRENGINTGASSDLSNATNIAFSLLGSYGMDEEKLVVLSKEEMLGSAAAQDYINEVNAILRREMNETIKLIEDHRELIDRIAKVLMDKNHLTGDEFLKLTSEGSDSK